MGMFDTIQWGDNLPFTEEMKGLGLAKNNWSFQTKDFDCCLADYVVQDGKLFLKKYKNEKWVEGDPKAENFMDRLGSLDRTEPYLEAQKSVTHTVYMYEYRHDVVGLWDCSIEFKAVFVHGAVESVELVRFEKLPNAERKRIDREWKEHLELINSYWYNRFIFHTSTYRWVRHILSRAFYKTGTFFQTISYKLP